MGTPTGLHPLKRTLDVATPAVAQGATDSAVIGRAPFTGVVSAARFTPKAAIAGADTNTRRVSIVNRGQGGAGAAEVAARQFNAGVNGVAFDEGDLTLSATAANLNVAAGDVLEFRSAAVGTGIADPGGSITVELTRD